MRGQSGMPGNEYADGMIEMDMNVGKLLKTLDDLKIADNTIVVFTTDNGPNAFTWPDAATTPFRSEKDTNWEGAFRVPAFIRWPGHIKPGAVKPTESCRVSIGSRHSVAAAGDPGVKDRLLNGWQPQGSPTTFRDHLDGFNQLDYLTGKTEQERARTSSIISTTMAGSSLPCGKAIGKYIFGAGAGSAWSVRRLGPSVHAFARAESIQSAHGSYEHAEISGRHVRTSGGVENAYLIAMAQIKCGRVLANLR